MRRTRKDDVGDIILPVNDLEGAQQISTEAVKQNKVVQYQILVDSGMGRLGLLLANAHQEIKKIIKLPISSPISFSFMLAG